MECTHGRAAPSGRGALFHCNGVKALFCTGKGRSHTGRALTADQNIHLDSLMDLTVCNGIGNKCHLALTGSSGAAQSFFTGRETALHLCGRCFRRCFHCHAHSLLDAGGGSLLDSIGGIGSTRNAVDLGALCRHQGLAEILGRVTCQINGLIGGIHRYIRNSILGKSHADGHLAHAGSLGSVSAGGVDCSAARGSRGACTVAAGCQCTGGHTAHGSGSGQLDKARTRNLFHSGGTSFLLFP